MFFRKSLLQEKLEAEHPLTDEDRSYWDVRVKKPEPMSNKELAARSYETVRNALAVAGSEFPADELIAVMQGTHGKTYRALNTENEKDCSAFVKQCGETLTLVKQHVAFLREERWYNGRG